MRYAKGKQIFLDSLDIGILNVQNNINTTGSIVSTGTSSSITGSFKGNLDGNAKTATTASFTVSAFNSISSSYSVTASYVAGNVSSASYATTAQNAVTASYSNTSTNALVAISASFANTSSYTITSETSSYSNNFTINSSEILGESLTTYNKVTASINGSNLIFSQNTSSYTSAFFKYTAFSGSNSRVSEVLAVWNNTSITYTDFSTVDIGSTTDVTSSVSIISGLVQFKLQTNSSNWVIKSLVTYL